VESVVRSIIRKEKQVNVIGILCERDIIYDPIYKELKTASVKALKQLEEYKFKKKRMKTKITILGQEPTTEQKKIEAIGFINCDGI